MGSLQQFGLGLIQAFQSLSPAFDGVMRLFSFLGRIEFYLLFIPFLFWAIDSRLGMRTLLILIVTDMWGTFFKLLFHQPRPYWIGAVKALAEEPSYGIPSTHASDSLAVWGYLGVRVRNRWLWIGAGLLVLFIGLSRLYLGVHFPHDVVVGWLLGAAVVWVFVRSEGRVAAWAGQQALLTQIGASLVLSLAVILAGQLIQVWLAGRPDPEAWRAFAVAARTPTSSFTLAGALFGALAGYALMRRRARFGDGGPWLSRAGRYGLGLIGVLVIYFGLDVGFSLVASDETALGYALRFLRYAAVTFWVTFAAPWLFLKLRLAEPAGVVAGPQRPGPGPA